MEQITSPVAEAATIAIFYDTETTGLPLFKEPSEDPRQPHIVQLGVKVVDMISRKTLQAVDIIVRPNGWDIPKEASDVHGITTEMAYDLGIPEEAVAEIMLELWRPEAPRLRIGHNEPFDARILRIALKRFFGDELADGWKEGASQCTMRMATPIMQLPPTEKMKRAGFGGKPKQANLAEAYEFFTGRKLEGAHNAMIDVDGCIDVYWAIQDGITERVAA